MPGRAMSESETWTVLELLRWTSTHFASRGIETARLDAECLLAAALATDRLRLYIDYDQQVGPAERARFRELVRQRADLRIPVAQLTGAKEFWSLKLRVTPDVLVPRPESETLVSAVLGLLGEPEAEFDVLDLGTGSGALALAIASECPKAHFTATDRSGAALAVARDNAANLGLADRIRFVEGDLFGPLAGELFDVIVSNPPYVAETQAALLPPELSHEPPEALFAGPDGMAVLAPLLQQAREFLKPGGILAVESAPSQSEGVRERCRGAGLESVTMHRDLAGRARAVTARAPAES